MKQATKGLIALIFAVTAAVSSVKAQFTILGGAGIYFTSSTESIGQGEFREKPAGTGQTFSGYSPVTHDSDVMFEAYTGTIDFASPQVITKTSDWTVEFNPITGSSLTSGQSYSAIDLASVSSTNDPQYMGLSFTLDGRTASNVTGSVHVVEYSSNEHGVLKAMIEFSLIENGDPSKWISGSVEFSAPNLSPSPIPEPSTYAVIAGMIALGIAFSVRQRKSP